MYRLLAALAHLVTDAKMRPEVKLVLGIPIMVAAVIYGIASRDWVGFGALSGVALVLLGITAAADAQIDKGA